MSQKKEFEEFWRIFCMKCRRGFLISVRPCFNIYQLCFVEIRFFNENSEMVMDNLLYINNTFINFVHKKYKQCFRKNYNSFNELHWRWFHYIFASLENKANYECINKITFIDITAFTFSTVVVYFVFHFFYFLFFPIYHFALWVIAILRNNWQHLQIFQSA
jgi:hypothetical protein